MSIEIKEGKVRKGGRNNLPTTERPATSPPGQGPRFDFTRGRDKQVHFLQMEKAVPIAKLARYQFIITTHPTMEDIKRAEKESKMILVIVRKHKSIIDLASSKKWLKKFLAECDVGESEYLCIFCIPKQYDLEEAREWLLNEYDRFGPEPWKAFYNGISGIKGLTSIGGINIVNYVEEKRGKKKAH